MYKFIENQLFVLPESDPVLSLSLRSCVGFRPDIKVTWKFDWDYYTEVRPSHILLVEQTEEEYFGPNQGKVGRRYLVPIKEFSKKMPINEAGMYYVSAILVRFDSSEMEEKHAPRMLDRFSVGYFKEDYEGMRAVMGKIEVEKSIFYLKKSSELPLKGLKLFFGIGTLPFYALFLIIFPTIFFLFGFCPKKPWQILEMFLNVASHPVRMERSYNFLYVSDAKRLRWYWNDPENPTVMPFCVIDLLFIGLGLIFLFGFFSQVWGFGKDLNFISAGASRAIQFLLISLSAFLFRSSFEMLRGNSHFVPIETQPKTKKAAKILVRIIEMLFVGSLFAALPFVPMAAFKVEWFFSPGPITAVFILGAVELPLLKALINKAKTPRKDSAMTKEQKEEERLKKRLAK